MWDHAKIVELFPDKRYGVVENSSMRVIFQFDDFRRLKVKPQRRQWHFRGVETCPHLNIGDEIYFESIATSCTRITAWTTAEVYLVAFNGNGNDFQKVRADGLKTMNIPSTPPPAYSNFQHQTWMQQGTYAERTAAKDNKLK